MKDIKLEWYVLYRDFNASKIRPYNILGGSFAETLKQEIKKRKIKDREQLKEYLKREFMYHYWSRSEFEIVVGGLSEKYSELEKIDIWDQIEMNFDNIIDYIISKMNLFKRKGKTNNEKDT